MLKEIILEAQKELVEYHNKLNPKLWDKDQLKSVVIKKLEKIADDYQMFLGIPNLKVKDVIVSGSNANFNWTESSDIDLHLVADFAKLKEMINPDMLANYNKFAKKVYNDMHNIRIYGFKVELYLQDATERAPKDQGTYSIMNKKWISHPTAKHLTINDVVIKKKIKDYTDRINQLHKHGTKNSLHQVEQLREELTQMRGHGLSQTGEFSVENIVFKALRSRGYIDKLSNMEKRLVDREFSLS